MLEGWQRYGGVVVEYKQFSNWGFRFYKNLNLGKAGTHIRKGERWKKIGFHFN